MATEDFHMTMTYDPAAGTVTPEPSSVKVSKGNQGRIVVDLVLSEGAQGSAVFGDPPLIWSQSTGSPPGAIVEPPNGGTSRVTILDPNLLHGHYHFLANPMTGALPVHSEDPTIINEGTGGR